MRPDSLSRERILDAAGAIVNAEGSAALSMRRLAQELDVWPMSIYRHFKNKDELLDAVAAAATESIAVPDIDASWRAQLRSLLDAVRDVIGSDPSGVGTRLPNAFLTPGGLRLSEAGMRILESAGFDPAEAA